MVYSDVVKKGLLQPYKKNYGMKDFKKLVDSGLTQLSARFVLLCTIAYYNIDCKQECFLQESMCGNDFFLKCQQGKAI